MNIRSGLHRLSRRGSRRPDQGQIGAELRGDVVHVTTLLVIQRVHDVVLEDAPLQGSQVIETFNVKVGPVPRARNRSLQSVQGHQIRDRGLDLLGGRVVDDQANRGDGVADWDEPIVPNPRKCAVITKHLLLELGQPPGPLHLHVAHGMIFPFEIKTPAPRPGGQVAVPFHEDAEIMLGVQPPRPCHAQRRGDLAEGQPLHHQPRWQRSGKRRRSRYDFGLSTRRERSCRRR